MSGLFDAASEFGRRTDTLFLVLTGVSAAVAGLLGIVAVYFCVRYRAGSRAERGDPPTTGRRLEWSWTAVPLLAFIGLFLWSAHDYARLARPPEAAATVYVTAKQWVWTLQHADGRREIDELHLPAGRPVRLVMASQDVIHSFYVPAFRVKQDVVPGRYTTLWFTPDRPGRFRLLCAEYCGTEHASMAGGIIVLAPADYARWLDAQGRDTALRSRGRELFRASGCIGCHDARSSVHAPDLRGIFGRRVFLQDGSAVVADEAYLRDAILVPGKQVVAGYAPIMPQYAGQLSEADVIALLEYLRQPDDADPAPARRPG